MFLRIAIYGAIWQGFFFRNQNRSKTFFLNHIAKKFKLFIELKNMLYLKENKIALFCHSTPENVQKRFNFPIIYLFRRCKFWNILGHLVQNVLN